MAEQFHIQELSNGLTLLGQTMEGVSSAALTLLVRAGASHDPPDAEGAATVAAEWILRGAGGMDSRQLNDLLDSLGCQHDESVQSEHISFNAAQLGQNLPQVLAIYRQMLREPNFADETFEPCRQLTLQDLASLEDEPARKANILLRERFYPYPLGRCVYGHEESLQIMRPQDVRQHAQAAFTPQQAILTVAGNIDWDNFVKLAKQHFGDWQGPPPSPVHPTAMPPGELHIPKATAQTHIAIAQAAVPLADDRHYAARVAETVLSGGMSSRLFTEVREKRALVYGVGSRYHSLKAHAGLFTYAGTRPEVAQQTYDVTVGELRRLAEGIEAGEMARAKTQLKAALVMQGESTSARASALASDWYHIGRLKSLQEISDAIEAVRVEDVLGYLKQFPPDPLTVLVLGPEALKL